MFWVISQLLSPLDQAKPNLSSFPTIVQLSVKQKLNIMQFWLKQKLFSIMVTTFHLELLVVVIIDVLLLLSLMEVIQTY